MQAAGCQRSLLFSRGTGAASLRQHCRPSKARRRPACVRVSAHRVQVNVNGRKEVLDVSEDQTILEVALEQGIELSHDCKMGVCMTCPAKLVRAGFNSLSTLKWVCRCGMQSAALLQLADRSCICSNRNSSLHVFSDQKLHAAVGVRQSGSNSWYAG